MVSVTEVLAYKCVCLHPVNSKSCIGTFASSGFFWFLYSFLFVSDVVLQPQLGGYLRHSHPSNLARGHFRMGRPNIWLV